MHSCNCMVLSSKIMFLRHAQCHSSSPTCTVPMSCRRQRSWCNRSSYICKCADGKRESKCNKHMQGRYNGTSCDTIALPYDTLSGSTRGNKHRSDCTGTELSRPLQNSSSWYDKNTVTSAAISI